MCVCVCVCVAAWRRDLWCISSSLLFCIVRMNRLLVNENKKILIHVIRVSRISSEDLVSDVGRILFITDLQEADSGKYTCTAVYTSSQRLEAHVNLTTIGTYVFSLFCHWVGGDWIHRMCVYSYSIFIYYSFVCRFVQWELRGKMPRRSSRPFSVNRTRCAVSSEPIHQQRSTGSATALDSLLVSIIEAAAAAAATIHYDYLFRFFF